MSEVPELTTERLLMRGWREDDFEPWVAIMGDAAVHGSLGRAEAPPPGDIWRELAFLAGHWVLKGFGHWVLEARDTGEIVGRAGLLHPPEWPDLEVGWTVAREHWGQGYAPEAGRAACEWAHEELGARHIVSLIHASNANSIRVAEKLGEKHEGQVHVRGLELEVYGADLPLSGSRAQEAGTRPA